MKKIELLAPVGDKERLEAAIYYGCDAVYFAGKKFGLRAFGTNFDLQEIKEAVDLCHQNNVKVYITVNILAHNKDFEGLLDYLKYLDECGVDGVIVSDLGIAYLVKQNTNLELHVSTQANITNIESARAWVRLGAKRLVLARELSLEEVKQIKEAVGENIDIECFCHGAMCISYSGRCLLSNYLTGRDSNKGECAQPCRWGYTVSPQYDQHPSDEQFPIAEDERGTYVFNSKDMCLIEYLKELINAGITSFKIEGRMKSTFYVATTVNAYRRAIDAALNNKELDFDPIKELEKTSHREFTTGFYYKDEYKTNTKSSQPVQDSVFVGLIKEDAKDGYVSAEIRNRFKVGDVLEILSPSSLFNTSFQVEEILDKNDTPIEIANSVQEVVKIKTTLKLKKNDILRILK